MEENPPQGLVEKLDSSQRGTYITIVVIFIKINFFQDPRHAILTNVFL